MVDGRSETDWPAGPEAKHGALSVSPADRQFSSLLPAVMDATRAYNDGLGICVTYMEKYGHTVRGALVAGC
jgi:hypothetical protein